MNEHVSPREKRDLGLAGETSISPEQTYYIVRAEHLQQVWLQICQQVHKNEW